MSYVLIALLILGAALAGLHLWTRRLARAAEAAVPRAGEVQPVPGGAIHFVEAGPKDAPPVLLIHGISAQLQHFTYAVSDLLKDDFRVIAIDRPGCGYSRRERDEDAALPAQARMIADFLTARGIEAPVVAGHSLGGAVTLALALDRPDLVSAVALIAPLTQVPGQIHPIFKGLEVRSAGLRRFLSQTVAVPLARLTTGKVLAHAFAPEAPPPDFLIRAAGILGLRPGAYVTACCDLVMQEHALPAQVARYGTLSRPGGVLFGADDELLPAEAHGPPMERFGLRYETLPGRGHMLPITAPEDCAAFIRRIATDARAGRVAE